MIDFAGVSLDSIRSVLLANGWSIRGSNYQGATLWIPPKGSAAVLVPDTDAADDWADRIEDLVRALQDTHGGDARAWIERLTLGDLLNFRAAGGSLAPGTIGIEEGASFFASVRDSLNAAAKSWNHRLPYLGRNGLRDARSYLAAARFGQTQVGSYVVTVHTGLSADFIAEPTTLMVSSDSTGVVAMDAVSSHKVTEFFVSALDATQKAVREFRSSQNPEVLHEAVEAGVSADLMKAVGTMIRASGEGVQFDAQWSRQTAAELVSSKFFSRADAPQLEAAAGILRAVERVGGASVTGIVESLTRREAEDGTVTLVAWEGDTLRGRKVRMSLNRTQYRLAVEAHRDGALITAAGNLEHVGSRWWLRQVQHVGLSHGNRLKI